MCKRNWATKSRSERVSRTGAGHTGAGHTWAGHTGLLGHRWVVHARAVQTRASLTGAARTRTSQAGVGHLGVGKSGAGHTGAIHTGASQTRAGDTAAVRQTSPEAQERGPHTGGVYLHCAGGGLEQGQRRKTGNFLGLRKEPTNRTTGHRHRTSRHWDTARQTMTHDTETPFNKLWHTDTPQHTHTPRQTTTQTPLNTHRPLNKLRHMDTSFTHTPRHIMTQCCYQLCLPWQSNDIPTVLTQQIFSTKLALDAQRTQHAPEYTHMWHHAYRTVIFDLLCQQKPMLGKTATCTMTALLLWLMYTLTSTCNVAHK